MAVKDGELVYEVSLRVQRTIAAEYLPWLRTHIERMLTLPGFLHATLYAIDDQPATEDAGVAWCVHYRLRDRSALEDYLRDHAPRIREEGVLRFGAGFRAERRILRVLGGDGIGGDWIVDD